MIKTTNITHQEVSLGKELGLALPASLLGVPQD